MTSGTLYEIADLRQIIDAALEESEGELTPEIEAALNAWDERFDAKAESVALYVCEQERLAEAAKAEAAKLNERAHAFAKRAESLHGYLESQMKAVGRTEIRGVLKTLKIQKNNPKVDTLTAMDEAELRNIALFAPKYVRHSESWALDKKAILDDHKAGTLDADVAKRVAIVRTEGLRIK